MTAVPWTYEARPDTQTSNVRLGIWLFLASEAMLFGSFFSAYVLLRAGSTVWPDGSGVLSLPIAAVNTVLLVAAAVLIGRGRALLSTLFATVFLIVKLIDYRAKLSEGLLPSTNLMLGCWFVLTGAHALHVVGGVIANTWIAIGTRAGGTHHLRQGDGGQEVPPRQMRERLYALRLYWYFVDLVWLAILVSFYLV